VWCEQRPEADSLLLRIGKGRSSRSPLWRDRRRRRLCEPPRERVELLHVIIALTTREEAVLSSPRT
jgi:hypothetical protein